MHFNVELDNIVASATGKCNIGTAILHRLKDGKWKQLLVCQRRLFQPKKKIIAKQKTMVWQLLFVKVSQEKKISKI